MTMKDLSSYLTIKMSVPPLGCLYVCATPIGNLSDCSPRLLDTLKQADYIAAEDTRITRRLLSHFDIKTPLFSLHQHNEAARITLIKSYLQDGKQVALVSDAGTPNISDPGALLIQSLAQEGYKITPIAGPSSITTLLSISGVMANQFFFAGFFPRKDSEAQAALDTWIPMKAPIFFFETALRLIKTLEWLHSTNLVETMVLGKELTKQYEKVYRGSVEEIKTALQIDSLKGEWCFVITLKQEPKLSQADIKTTVDGLKQQGLTRYQILHVAKLLNYPKNTVYDMILHD